MSSEMRILLFIVTFTVLFYFVLFNFAITDSSINDGNSFAAGVETNANIISSGFPYLTGNPLLDAFGELAWIFVRIGAFFGLMFSLTGWLSTVTGGYGLFFTMFNIILLVALGYIGVRLLRGGA